MIIKPDPKMGLRALTIRQPYCNEILSGEKPEEYRCWSTNYRGDILITASANPRVAPHGCAFCVVELYDVEGEPEDYAWLLRNPRAVKNLPTLGKLKLWIPDASLVAKLGLRVG